LPRVYTDASVYAPVTLMLSQLGWDIETAQHAGLTGKIDDTKWVIYARKHNRIAITFDELKAKQGVKVSRELRQRGGKIVRVNGACNEYRAIGKLLYHYREWYTFLTANNGISVISEPGPQKFKNYTPEEYHQHYHHLDAELFTNYLEKRKNRPFHPRKRKRHISPDQGILTDGSSSPT
jgi:hypothetical protein